MPKRYLDIWDGSLHPLEAFGGWSFRQKTPEDLVSFNEAIFYINEALGSLQERQERVIRLRFFYGQTLELVGNQLGVTKERIRQIELRALRKLRHPARSRRLRWSYGILIGETKEYPKLTGRELLEVARTDTASIGRKL
jgi:hypothetical protein